MNIDGARRAMKSVDADAAPLAKKLAEDEAKLAEICAQRVSLEGKYFKGAERKKLDEDIAGREAVLLEQRKALKALDEKRAEQQKVINAQANKTGPSELGTPVLLRKREYAVKARDAAARDLEKALARDKPVSSSGPHPGDEIERMAREAAERKARQRDEPKQAKAHSTGGPKIGR
jgi:hypothetical protein